MKQKETYSFGEEDDKVIQLFNELGMPKNLAKTLMYISQFDECKSAEIEKCANLRQPEVSIVMQELQKQGWVTKYDLKKEGKGRPAHIYKLTIDLSDILESISREKTKEIENIKTNLERLRNILKEG